MKFNISKRVEELIERGNKLYKNGHTYAELASLPFRFQVSDDEFSDFLHWKLSVNNILKQIYGEKSEYFILFLEIFSSPNIFDRTQYNKEVITAVLGILKSAKEEFDLGFTHKIEHIIAVEFFDNILEQAKELLEKGWKYPAAILGRIIIENSLKDLCRRNDISFKDDEKVSILNEMLKDKQIFTLPQFKLCRTNIELGNDAAHGNSSKYSHEDVKKMFEYIENHLLVL